ncbi:MAG: TolC family protein [Proteobacteria bacterium]|nr:TolC family protein [Pseudomonadota bacterium]MBU4296612.1 TolC family protein [Pseudomonadota bacterium]MCG2748241.1 TolC family protein [Desulfobulbaceae bacterium]
MKAVIFLLVAVCLNATFLPPASGIEKSISLREAILASFTNNHELKGRQSQLEASRADIGIARSSLLPSVVIEEKFQRTANPTYSFMSKLNQERFTAQDFAIDSLNNPDAINDFQTMFSIEQPLFVRQASIGLDMAKKQHEIESMQYLRKKEEIALEVVKTFLMVRTSREYVDVTEKGVDDAREHVRLSELRFNNGLGLYSDILRTRTALAEAEQKLVSAQKNHDVAKKGLGLLLGLDDSVDAGQEQVDLPLMEMDYYNQASLQREDVKALEGQRENARKNLALASAGYLPTVGLAGSYMLNDHNVPLGSEGESWLVAAVLRWQLFDGTKREYERIKAKHQISETEQYLQGLTKAVEFKVYEAYRSVEETRKNLELAQSALLMTEEGQRLVQVRYENLLSPLIDLLDAQVALDHARAMVVARENDHELVKATLSYESGTILHDLQVDTQ